VIQHKFTRCSILIALVVAIFVLPISGQEAGSKQNKQDTQAKPWEKIPVPPLHAFKPQLAKRIVLANGIVVFLQEDHELPFVSGSVLMRGGSRDEPAAKLGLVSLLGETWRTSGTAKMDGDAMDDLLEAHAAKIETAGGIASSSLSWDCLKGDFDQVFALSMDLLLNPKFSAEKLQLAQQQIATGIVRRNDDAEEILGSESQKLVYGAKSPYARQTEIANIMRVTLGDLSAWHKKIVQPANMIISVSGDFDSAAVEAKLRGTLEGLPKGEAFAEAKIEFPAVTPGIYFVDKADVNQSKIAVLGLGTDRKNPDLYALAVMNELFGEGFGSRLMQKIRTQLGLAYDVGGSYGASWDHPGVFRVEAGTKSETTVQTVSAIKEQIAELASKPVEKEEVSSAKDEILNSWIFEFDTKDKVLSEQVRLEFYGYPPDYFEKYRAGIEAVTTADVERVAKKYIHPDALAVLVVGNLKQITPALSTLGPVKTLDITIPMPPGMGGGPEAGAEADTGAGK
jgi:zinc protease